MEVHRKMCQEFNNKFKIEEAKLAEEMEKKILCKVGELEDFVDKIDKVTKYQKSQIDGIRQKTLNQFSQMKYIQSLEERNRDPKYLQLLKSKPIDPAEQKRFKTTERKVW